MDNRSDNEEPQYLSPAEARRRQREADLADNQCALSEDSVALEFRQRYAGLWRYCHDNGVWFTWTGFHWKLDKKRRARDLVRTIAREMKEGLKPGDARTMGRRAFSLGVEGFCQSDPTFAVAVDSWDGDPWLLGTPGGTVELRTGFLRPSDPNDGITKLTSVRPAATADCSRWMQFLDEATGGDAGLTRFLQQWMGYALTGVTTEHALVFVYGDGGNGKSVFLNVVSSILSDYAATAAMDSFTVGRGDKHSTDMAMLRGARLVTASETEQGRPWAEARLKSLTGGDPITARFIRRDNFTFNPQFKLMIAGNHKPELENIDDAIKRRLHMVPFTRRPENPDPELEAKLKAEGPGILRWMIDGCLDWQVDGRLFHADSIRVATDEYLSDQDVIGQWLEENCRVDIGNSYLSENTGDLFRSWQAYAVGAGAKANDTKWLVASLVKRGFRRTRTSRVRMIEGVQLLRPASFHNDA